MKIRTKFIGLLLVITCLIALGTAQCYAYPSDIKGNPAEKQIIEWINNGVVEGYSDGTFKPNRNITRAEFVTLINKTFGFNKINNTKFSDVKSSDWFNREVRRAAAEGYISTKSKYFKPYSKVATKDAVTMLSSVSKGIKLNEIKFKSNLITRADAIMLLDSVAGTIFNKPGTFGPTENEKNIDGNVTISRANVKLQNIKIQGNLYLTSGIGNGNVELDNVTVIGRTIVSGGGEHSIIIRNSNLGAVTVIKEGGKVRIVATGSTNIGQVSLNSGGTLEEREVTGTGFENVVASELTMDSEIVLDGDFENVSIEAPGVILEVSDGNIGSLEVCEQAANAIVNISGGAVNNLTLDTTTTVNAQSGSIENLNVNENAANTAIQVSEGASVGILNADSSATVTGTGKVETANINSDGVSIEQKPANTNVNGGTTATVGGNTVSGTNSSGSTGSSGGYTQTKVSMNIINSMILINETSTLNARDNVSLTPSDASLSFSSSNAQKVSISDGIITGLERGIATITVTASKTGYAETTSTFEVAVEPIELSWTDPSGERKTGDKFDIDFNVNLLDDVTSIDGVTYIVKWMRDVQTVSPGDITLLYGAQAISGIDGIYYVAQNHKILGNESNKIEVTFNVPGNYKFEIYADKE